MAMKRIPVLVLVLLGAAATFSGVAIADEEEQDSRCSAPMCVSGLSGNAQCRTLPDFLGCNNVCNQNNCDGGSQEGDPFGCPVGNPFILCQCNSCRTGGGNPGDGDGGGSGPGDGGGGIGCSDCLCNDEVCDDNCWWAGWEWGECSHGECWCHSDLN